MRTRSFDPDDERSAVEFPEPRGLLFSMKLELKSLQFGVHSSLHYVQAETFLLNEDGQADQH